MSSCFNAMVSLSELRSLQSDTSWITSSRRFHCWTPGAWYKLYMSVMYDQTETVCSDWSWNVWAHQIWDGAVKLFGILLDCFTNIRTPLLFQYSLTFLEEMFEVRVSNDLINLIHHNLGDRQGETVRSFTKHSDTNLLKTDYFLSLNDINNKQEAIIYFFHQEELGKKDGLPFVHPKHKAAWENGSAKSQTAHSVFHHVGGVKSSHVACWPVWSNPSGSSTGQKNVF